MKGLRKEALGGFLADSSKNRSVKSPETLSEILDLEISDLSRGGSGVAKDEQGRVIFVPLSAPGDLLKVRVTDQKKRYAEGEIIEILKPSPQRIQPRCKVFGQCGGCQWQHLPYELQWKTKFMGVSHALKRVGIELKSFEEKPADSIYGYRNRIQMRGKGSQFGFFERGSNRLVSIDRCEIARAEINSEIEKLKNKADLPQNDYKIEIETNPSGKVSCHWNSKHAAGGFRQVNDEQNNFLVQWVQRSLTRNRTVVDLFGGSGNLSLGLASQMKQIYCVDLGKPRLENPVPPNFHLIRSDVKKWLSTFKWDAGEGFSVIIDPPREGLLDGFNEVAEPLQKWGADELIAVGCDPDSWARDLSKWIKKGWKIESALAIDLFPQTSHVESVALLRYLP